MLRKVLIFFTILLIAFLGYFSYKLLKEKEVAVNSLIDAVPFDASVIIEINRPELLFNIIYSPPIDAESFLTIPYIRDPLEKLKTIDSVASQNKTVKSTLRRPHSAIISGHQVGKDELEFIYYLKLNTEKEFLLIDKVIRQNVKAKGNISNHNYEDARIYDVTVFNRRSGGFSYTYYQGIFILSKSSILVEEVIRQVNSDKSILTKAGLETVMRTAGKSTPLNIYINFDYFPKLALNFIHSRFKSELNAISKFAHWIELDLNINDNVIVLNGFSSAENTTGFLSDIFKDQEPFNLVLPGLLPSGTKSFFSIGITDYSKFKSNFSDYQQKNLPNPDFDKKINNFKRTTGVDLEEEFIKVFDNEVCFTYFPVSGDNVKNNIFTVIKTKGNNEARQFISQLEKSRSDSANENQRVYNTTAFNIPQLLFGNVFGLNKNSFCTINENFIIFGDSISNLNAFTAEFSQQKNLSLDQNYRTLADLLSEDSYCFFYLSPEAEQLYRYYLKYTSDHMLSQYKYGLSQVEAIVYQFGRNNDLFYNNAFIQFSPKPKGSIDKLWEVKLDNSPVSEIQLVKNHTTQKNEIVCQDKSNNLYLISHDGQILWKRNIGSKILSKIYQADLFLNKKLQLVFNTSSQIVALDRNGNNVEGYPVKLAKKANSGMIVLDYDKTRNYRFIIPSADQRLYCFDKTGKEVAGWEKPRIGLTPGEIKHFVINGKDFIVVPDESTIHFFDRKGQERIEPSKPIRVAINSEVFKNNSHFETTDSAGTINLIALNGSVSKIQTGIYPYNHYYLPSDLDFNKTDEHLFFYGRKFEGYTNTGARIINYPLNAEVTRKPKIINYSDSAFLFSFTDTTVNKIFLNNNFGDPLDGTPFSGNSEVTFELLKNSDQLLNLYYCNNNILYCISVK